MCENVFRTIFRGIQVQLRVKEFHGLQDGLKNIGKLFFTENLSFLGLNKGW